MSRLWVFCGMVAAVFFGAPYFNDGVTSAADGPKELWERATKASERGDSGAAAAALDLLLAQQPDLAEAWYLRGRERFRLGKFVESVADFDKFVALKPDQASRQWERGISLYYAGEFAKGAKQFVDYQTFHNADVENAAWRYLCQARAEGMEKARAAILPIEGDRRVPMMQIYDMFRGKLKPDDVLAAARAGEPGAKQLEQSLFYANLYVGLYYEAQGNDELARKHILSAEQHKIDHYMWDVARVHAERLREGKK